MDDHAWASHVEPATAIRSKKPSPVEPRHAVLARIKRRKPRRLRIPARKSA